MILYSTVSSYWFRYKGTYYSQEVAIKILKPERVNSDLQKEFAQEVYIMRFDIMSSATVLSTTLGCWIFLGLVCSLFLHFLLTCRKVRHKNVVQFIGACTKLPSLCIVTGKCQWNFKCILCLFIPCMNFFLHPPPPNLSSSIQHFVSSTHYFLFLLNRIYVWRKCLWLPTQAEGCF